MTFRDTPLWGVTSRHGQPVTNVTRCHAMSRCHGLSITRQQAIARLENKQEQVARPAANGVRRGKTCADAEQFPVICASWACRPLEQVLAESSARRSQKALSSCFKDRAICRLPRLACGSRRRRSRWHLLTDQPRRTMPPWLSTSIAAVAPIPTTNGQTVPAGTPQFHGCSGVMPMPVP